MKLIEPGYEILQKPDYNETIRLFSRVLATCYERQELDNPKRVIKECIKKDHPILEFADLTVKFTLSRAISFHLIRHRIASFMQSSTRFVNYVKRSDFEDEGLPCIRPSWFTREEYDFTRQHYDEAAAGLRSLRLESGEWMSLWQLCKVRHFIENCNASEQSYRKAVELHCLRAEEARDLLPHATQSSLVVKTNFRQWRHIFQWRIEGVTGTPHPDVKALLQPLQDELKRDYPLFMRDNNADQHEGVSE